VARDEAEVDRFLKKGILEKSPCDGEGGGVEAGEVKAVDVVDDGESEGSIDNSSSDESEREVSEPSAESTGPAFLFMSPKYRSVSLIAFS
jgi:hypothetical protein